MSVWKFFLSTSDNLDNYTADITNFSKDRQLTLSHNRSGNFVFTIPLTSDFLNYTETNKNCVVCLKNDNIVWSGPIWTRTIDVMLGKIEISAVGWFEILMNRFLWNNVPNYAEAGKNEGEIAFDLLTIANDDHPTWITKGFNTSNSIRKIKYEAWQSIGEEIINLSDMEDGFDIYVDPESRELNIKDASDYIDRSETAVFGYNWGADNISNLILEENGGELRNRIQVVGGNNKVYTYNSSSSQAENNLLTEVIQLTESKNDNVLQAIANAEGAIKENGILNYEMILKPQNESSYELFEDYNIGDKISFVAQIRTDKESFIMSHNPRIFAATVDIDDHGVERISSLQTTFSG